MSEVTKNIHLVDEQTETNGLSENQRESKRVLFYRGEFPEAEIEFSGKTYKAEVYDLSTDGIGIVPKVEIPGLDTISQKVVIRFGDSTPRPASLCNISHIKFSGSLRLKLGLSTEEIPPKFDDETVLSCTENMPLAYCEDPVAFNRTVLFNITHFTSRGVKLRLRSIDGAFFSGLKIDLNIMMPARGEFSSIVEVQEIKQSENVTELHCHWINCPAKLQNSISEFLLMTVPEISIKKMKQSGFLVADLEKAFIFKSAQSPKEVDRILALRLKAAKGEGRWLDTEDISLMTDSWDKHARQIYCEVNGQIVAASRIVFNNGIVERSEHVGNGVDIPKWLWDEGFVEGSRVCTDPEFRGTDVFFQMVQQMSHIVTQSGYRYLVLNCVDGLVPIYKKMVGVQSLNQQFYTEFMEDKPLNLLCIDFRSVQLGINSKHKTWAVNSPVGDDLISRGHIKLKWWEKILRFFFKPLHLMTRLITRHGNYEKAKRTRQKS